MINQVTGKREWHTVCEEWNNPYTDPDRGSMTVLDTGRGQVPNYGPLPGGVSTNEIFDAWKEDQYNAMLEAFVERFLQRVDRGIKDGEFDAVITD